MVLVGGRVPALQVPRLLMGLAGAGGEPVVAVQQVVPGEVEWLYCITLAYSVVVVGRIALVVVLAYIRLLPPGLSLSNHFFFSLNLLLLGPGNMHTSAFLDNYVFTEPVLTKEDKEHGFAVPSLPKKSCTFL